ncbi:hypothetical protein B0J13DRAFT_287023 [Dactylonectria estremocensis]|uniref:Uncharacterized protein n=1 Tax=Dactylonectria estremocensis TaxID=1079267 RepID=A0A9P9F3D3_9HYPO|nr:hypothetical protein B0J13DRAFT_287023 [Dactylonectria estremocensis]
MSSCNKELEFSENDISDLTGYVAIVTGGNGGIGYETTKQLALRNARVYIASRSQQRVDEAIAQMNQSADGKKLDLHFIQMDLQDLKSVKLAANLFLQQESRLDILINNAGICLNPRERTFVNIRLTTFQVMTVPYKLTSDGFETQFQVNYLAPYLMTSILLPLLLSTASQAQSQHRVRVINVASDLAFMGPKTIQFDDFNMTETKGMTELIQRYGHSKQAAIRHAKELNDRYSAQGVTAYSLHPGVIKTGLQGHDPTIVGTVMRTVMKYTNRTTALEGALNSLFCATSSIAPERGEGKYFAPVGKHNPKADKWLNDRETNARLWQQSEMIITSVQ